MTFDTQFGPEYAVEETLLYWLKGNGFEDDSWGNDICPKFAKQLSETRRIEIWVDALDRNERESGPAAPRFMVFDYNDDADCSPNYMEFHDFVSVQRHVEFAEGK